MNVICGGETVLATSTLYQISGAGLNNDGVLFTERLDSQIEFSTSDDADCPVDSVKPFQLDKQTEFVHEKISFTYDGEMIKDVSLSTNMPLYQEFYLQVLSTGKTYNEPLWVLALALVCGVEVLELAPSHPQIFQWNQLLNEDEPFIVSHWN